MYSNFNRHWIARVQALPDLRAGYASRRCSYISLFVLFYSASSSGGGLKRSFSSPNIADLIKDEQDKELKRIIPNRSNKPRYCSSIEAV